MAKENKNKKGVVRCIDPLGRLVIPKEVRKELGLLQGEPVEMITEKDCVIIRKYKAVCILCGCPIKDEKDAFIIHDKKICPNCQEIIKKY
jgi:transcriptional pleiotropic regulator of transition state genes